MSEFVEPARLRNTQNDHGPAFLLCGGQGVIDVRNAERLRCASLDVP
jgi:hypothetical protein